MNGNVHTVEALIRGTPETVRREVLEIAEAFQGEPRLIIGTGDQVGVETPDENIASMVETARGLQSLAVGAISKSRSSTQWPCWNGGEDEQKRACQGGHRPSRAGPCAQGRGGHRSRVRPGPSGRGPAGQEMSPRDLECRVHEILNMDLWFVGDWPRPQIGATPEGYAILRDVWGRVMVDSGASIETVEYPIVDLAQAVSYRYPTPDDIPGDEMRWVAQETDYFRGGDHQQRL